MTGRASLTGRTSPSPLVLVADNNADIRVLIVEVLRELGVTVVEAADGAEAVRLVVEQHRMVLSCALLDLRMPVLDGLGAVRAIRQVTPRLPIVMMSTMFPHGFQLQVEMLHIAHVLEKPFHLNELRSVVRDSIAVPAETDNDEVLRDD
jgi:CheY-like chemotaxis protein